MTADAYTCARCSSPGRGSGGACKFVIDSGMRLCETCYYLWAYLRKDAIEAAKRRFIQSSE